MKKISDEQMKKLAIRLMKGFEPGESGGIDGKRPFGNSDIEGDVLQIIGAAPEDEEDGDAVWSERQLNMAGKAYDELPRWIISNLK